MDPNAQNAQSTQNTQPPPTSAAPRPVDPYYSEKSGGSFIKKIIFIIIGIVLLVLVVVGGIFLINTLRGASKPKNINLVYWGIWEDANVMAPIIADFERTHPNIKIQYQKQDIKGLGDHIDRLSARINNGTGPDIVRFHSSWTRQVKRYLLPFPKSVTEQIQLEKDYYKTVLTDMKMNGAYYGVPLGVDTLSLFVNTDMLASKGLSIPDDWNDIYTKYAPELVVKDQSGKITTPAIGMGTFDNISHASDIVALLFLQNGANLEELAGSTKENAESAIRYYTLFSEGDQAVWDSSLDNSTLAFAKGNLPLYFGYSWDIFTIKALNPELNFQTVKVPTLAGRTNTVASYWAEGVSVKSKNSKEAFEFLTYLSQPSTLQKLHETQAKARLFGSLYPRKSMAPLLSSNNLVYPFISQADNAQSTFFSSDTYDGDNGMVTRMNIYLGNAIRSVNGNTSAESAVETLAKGVAQVLSGY